MKKIYALLLTIVVSFSIAQEDSPTTYSSLFHLAGSKHEPAVLGDDYKNVHIGIVNAYVWAGNTTLNIDQLSKITNGNFDKSDASSVFDGDRRFHRFGAGANIDVLNVGVRFNNPDETEMFSVSLGASLRTEANYLISDNFFKLAYRGNGSDQFRGKKVNMPIAFNSFGALEYSLGFAMPIPLKVKDFDFKGGVRLKYLRGIYSAYTENAQFDIETHEKGEFVNLGYQYEFHTTLDTSFSLDNEFSGGGLPNAGTGFGADIGVTAHYTLSDNSGLYGNINLLDIGAITWKDRGTVYKNEGVIRYEGVEIDNIFSDDIILNDSIFDEIIEDAESFEEQEEFRMPYPLRMRLHLSYKIQGQTSKDVRYDKHTIGFTYIQGFRDLGNATKRPYFAAGYLFNLNNILEVGTNFGVFGYNRFESGLFLGVRGGPFRFGIGSGNILSLARRVGTGADFNFNMTLAF